jgi:hypothetical protein
MIGLGDGGRYIAFIVAGSFANTHETRTRISPTPASAGEALRRAQREERVASAVVYWKRLSPNLNFLLVIY